MLMFHTLMTEIASSPPVIHKMATLPAFQASPSQRITRLLPCDRWQDWPGKLCVVSWVMFVLGVCNNTYGTLGTLVISCPEKHISSECRNTRVEISMELHFHNPRWMIVVDQSVTVCICRQTWFPWRKHRNHPQSLAQPIPSLECRQIHKQLEIQQCEYKALTKTNWHNQNVKHFLNIPKSKQANV